MSRNALLSVLFVVASGVAMPAVANAANAAESAVDKSSAKPAVPPRSGFVLSVDTDGPGAASLVSGDYDAAIKSASRATRLSDERSAYLTLCAAYIGKAALAEARDACNAAVDAAQAPLTTARVPYGHRDRDGLAKAYSNRAILRVLLGEMEAAREDIELASRQNRHLEVVEHNHDVMSASPRLARRD